MNCEKCSGPINAIGKCTLCGHENGAQPPVEKYEWNPRTFRSARLTVFMYLTIGLDALVIISLVYLLFAGTGLSPWSTGLSILILALSAFDIIIALCILRLKKWALNTYIGLSIISGILNIARLNFIPVVLRAVLLYFVFKEDWDYFE